MGKFPTKKAEEMWPKAQKNSFMCNMNDI